MSELEQYVSLVNGVKDLVYSRQYEAMKSVNKELINLYWEIGKKINTQQTERGWGKSVVELLAKELQKEFPKVKGFSARNLWNMRNFHLAYVGNEKLQPMVAEISWTKNIIIMQRCKGELEREFYIRVVKKFGWTKNVLINNLENKAYEKYLSNQTNFDETVPEAYKYQAKLAVKDDYNFDFLEMGLEHSEAELEAALIQNIRSFLSEMGEDFTFIGSQYRLEIDGADYFIDLLLFHRRLKCLIAIDLKIGVFKPEHLGKMQFYLTALDDMKKLGDENPSIGIIICKNKNRTTVEYALKGANRSIGVATYNLYNKLPFEMKNLLPDPDEIVRRLGALEQDIEVITNKQDAVIQYLSSSDESVGMMVKEESARYQLPFTNWWT